MKIKKLLALVLSLFVLTTSLPSSVKVSATTVNIPNDAVKYNGNYYQIFNQSMTWHDAKLYCEKIGGHLVTINSQSEQEFITSLITQSEKSYMWIGAYCVNNEFFWVTEEDFLFTNWDDGEPNNVYGTEDVVMMYGHNTRFVPGTWNDASSDGHDRENGYLQQYGYICEWDNSLVTDYVEFSDNNESLNYPIYNSNNFSKLLNCWIKTSKYADAFSKHLENKSLSNFLEMTIDVPVMSDESTAYSIRGQTKIKDLMAYILFANEAQKYLKDVNAELQGNFDAQKSTAYTDFLERVKNFDVQYTSFQQKLNGDDSFNQTLQALLLAKTAMAIVDELEVTYKSGETEHIVFNKEGQTIDEFIEIHKEDIKSTIKLSSYSYFTDIYKSTISQSPEYYDDLQYYIMSGGDTSYLNSYYQQTLKGYATAIKDTKKLFEIVLDPDYEVSADISSLAKLGIDNLAYFAETYDSKYTDTIKTAKQTWEWAETGVDIIKAMSKCSLLGVASSAYDLSSKYIDEVKKVYDDAASTDAGWYALAYYYLGKNNPKTLKAVMNQDTGSAEFNISNVIKYGVSYNKNDIIENSIMTRWNNLSYMTYSYTPDQQFRFYLWNACNNMINIESINCTEYKNMMLEYILAELNFQNGETGVQLNVQTSVNDDSLGSVSGEGNYCSGSTVTVKANCYENVKFAGWIDKTTGETVSHNAEFSFNLTKNAQLEARFVGGEFELAIKPSIPKLSVTNYSYYAGQDSDYLTITASDFNGSVTVDWYKNSTNKNYDGTFVSRGNTFTFPTDTKGTTYYYFVITNTVYSNVGTNTNESTASSVSQPIKVTVTAPIITDITLSKINNNECFINSEFNKSNIEVAVNYSDGTSFLTDSYSVNLDSSSAGKKTATIRLLGFTKTFDVTVLSEDSGRFGDLNWYIDLSNGSLNISGSTEMLAQQVPWSKHNSAIKTVTIENGIKSIANNAFYGCSNMNEINIPYSVSSISSSAFTNCNSLMINCHYSSAAKNYAINNGFNYSLISVKYDASGDGIVNAQDLTALKKYLLADFDISPDGNCNEDDAIDIRDLVHLKKKLAGIIA